ncbi:DGQHR domain-containing protein [Pseudomonas putida]|nr:DGQHR domain-containing protein [Pseudomonas putida]
MHNYKGFLVRQHERSEIDFVVFVARAKDVVQWAQADDIRLDRGNVQRALIESRWKQVGKFFRASDRNVIPTSVTIAFDEGLQRCSSKEELSDVASSYFMGEGVDGVVELVFSNAVQPFSFIIDGQHRLKGMAEADQDIWVPVCLFPSLSQFERAFQFITINNKSHKVPTDNLKALITNFADVEEGLRIRLTQASITAPKFATLVDVMNEDPESPFYKVVDWVNNRHVDKKTIIAPSAIENGLKAIKNGFLEAKSDDANAIMVMTSIWREIFSYYGVSYANIENFGNLTKKPVMQRITEMVVEFLVKEFDPAFSDGNIMARDAQEAGVAARKLIDSIPVEFWQEEWVMKSLDTSAGRDIISRGIRELKRQAIKNRGIDFDWRKGNPLYLSADD